MRGQNNMTNYTRSTSPINTKQNPFPFNGAGLKSPALSFTHLLKLTAMTQLMQQPAQAVHPVAGGYPAEVATLMAERKTFDFKNNKIQTMDLATLKRTHLEINPEGNPLRGIHHFQIIEEVAIICNKYNLDYTIEEIFAVNNTSKSQPGVTLMRKSEVAYGVQAIEAHCLRRLFTTIRIDNGQTEELTTTIVLTYHQEGVQAAIGPCVKACHNQCVLNAERKVSNYGKDKITTEQIFETIDAWLSQYEVQMTEDREKIARLRSIPVTEMELYAFIGFLTALRVAHDSENKELSARVPTEYPLNQAQITLFTEDALIKLQSKPILSMWDLYNIATEQYKPGRTSIPSVIEKNVAMVEALDNFARFKQPQAIPAQAVM